MYSNTTVFIDGSELKGFCGKVFRSLNLSPSDAEAAADVLVEADIRGIASHGVGRLKRYVNGLQTGQMLPDARDKVLVDSPSSIVIDADGGMGAPVSIKAMKQVIAKAEKNGAAFGCVRNSNHFGIAAYYAMMPLEHDMLGIAMTNTAALGVPTFARQVMFGTNPLAFAAPAKHGKSFVLDMSTTVVSRGKIEVYDRSKKSLPLNWAVDKTGKSATDAGSILEDMFHRYGGGILPLGGEGEQYGGYKGYGLAVMVDILCAVLCGAPFGPDICDTETSSARVSHFFGAVKIDCFRDPDAFRQDMDKMLTQLKETPLAEGREKVWYAGEKEYISAEQAKKKGVSVSRTVYKNLSAIARELNLPIPMEITPCHI